MTIYATVGLWPRDDLGRPLVKEAYRYSFEVEYTLHVQATETWDTLVRRALEARR